MNEYLEFRIKEIIESDSVLKTQFELLIKSTRRTRSEAHVKGGFCRDIILSILSKEASEMKDGLRIFDKEIKDIDVAINSDPEIYAKTLFDIAGEEGYEPIEYWNNGDKTDKGKNISVWCVKLFKGVEPIEIVHFRSDSYDPKTGKVVITDVEDSYSDDFRRDVPWPSLRLNDMKLVDYFGIIFRLNRGELIITTPPGRQDEMELIFPSFNPNIHHETVERILRLFKFVTTPYDSNFAYDFDEENRVFRSVTDSGFTLDPDIIRFYQTDDLSVEEHGVRTEIMENLVKWRDNRLLANVFGSIRGAVSRRPHQFIRFLIDFKILDVLFDSNHSKSILLTKTKIIEDELIRTEDYLSKPYAIFGFGCMNFKKLETILDLFSIDKSSIRLARVFDRDILLNHSLSALPLDDKKRLMMSEIYEANRSSYELELREFYDVISNFTKLNHTDISDEEYERYFTDMRKRKVLRPILIDYLILQLLLRRSAIAPDQEDIIKTQLVECLECRLNGTHYPNYPKLHKVIESNLLEDNHKQKQKQVRTILNDIRTNVMIRVDSCDDIYELMKNEADVFEHLI